MLDELRSIVGADHVRTDPDTIRENSTDATKRFHPADVIVFAGNAEQVSEIVRLANAFPARYRLRLSPSEIAYRRSGIRNPLVRPDSGSGVARAFQYAASGTYRIGSVIAGTGSVLQRSASKVWKCRCSLTWARL